MGRMYNRYVLSQGGAVYAGGEEDLSEKYNKGDLLYVEDGGQGLNLDEYLDLPDTFKTQVGVDVSKKSSNQRDYSDLDETFNLDAVVAA